MNLKHEKSKDSKKKFPLRKIYQVSVSSAHLRVVFIWENMGQRKLVSCHKEH